MPSDVLEAAEMTSLEPDARRVLPAREQERYASDVRPGHGQEYTNQKVNHVRRSIGPAAELEGGRFAVARRVMLAAGGHGKDAQQRRFATVTSPSRDTLRRPSMTLGARPHADPITQDGCGRPLLRT
jgi:hypothetical protein